MAVKEGPFQNIVSLDFPAVGVNGNLYISAVVSGVHVLDDSQSPETWVQLGSGGLSGKLVWHDGFLWCASYTNSNVAYWDGVNWHIEALPDSGDCRDILSYNGNLYVMCNSVYVNDGGSPQWQRLEGGSPVFLPSEPVLFGSGGNIYALHAINNGSFVENVPFYWDGSAWQQAWSPLAQDASYDNSFVGGGIGAHMAIAFNSQIYVGGGSIRHDTEDNRLDSNGPSELTRIAPGTTPNVTNVSSEFFYQRPPSYPPQVRWGIGGGAFSLLPAIKNGVLYFPVREYEQPDGEYTTATLKNRGVAQTSGSEVSLTVATTGDVYAIAANSSGLLVVGVFTEVEDVAVNQPIIFLSGGIAQVLDEGLGTLPRTVYGALAFTADDARPEITAIANDTVDDSVAYSVTPTLTADSGEVTEWRLVEAPSGATINSTTGQVSWTTTSTGSPHQFTVYAYNDNGFDTESWALTVNAPVADQAPVINAPPVQIASVGDYYTLLLTLSQGTQPVSWQLDSFENSTGSPTEVSHSPSPYLVVGSPADEATLVWEYAEAGNWTVSVTATNSASPENSDTETFVINVF